MSEAHIFRQDEDFDSIYELDGILIRSLGADYEHRKKITIIVEDK